MKKKILIIGQLPKEYGGTYSTGVANVIVNLLPFIPQNKYEKYLWASNITNFINGDLFGTKIYGISKFRLLYSLVRYFIKFPKRVFSYRKYYEFGIKPIRSLIYEASINELISMVKPDVIHVHNIAMLPSVYFANKSGKNIMLTFHGIFYNDKYSIEQSAKRGVDLKKLFKNSSKLISNFTVLTKSMKEEAIYVLGVSSKNICIVPNGVGNNFKFDEIERNELREKLRLKKIENLFISVGALTKRKNHLEAIKFLQRNYEDFHYIIIGKEGDYRGKIIEEIGEDSRITLIDYINNSELYKYYSAADYFIMPSTQEGQSLVCLEAFACGLPVLINENIIGTLGVDNSFNNYYKEILLDGKDIIIPKRLTNLERGKLSELSFEKLTWSNVTKKYVTIYDEIFD